MVIKCVCLQLQKTHSCNRGPLCKETNFPPFQFMLQVNCPFFQALVPPRPSLSLINSFDPTPTHTVCGPILNKQKMTLAHQNSSWSNIVGTRTVEVHQRILIGSGQTPRFRNILKANSQECIF